MTPVSLTIVQSNGNCIATPVQNAVELREHLDAKPWVILYCENDDQASRLADMMMAGRA